MKKISVISTNRADYGLLSGLIKLIKKEKKLQLNFIVTGSHLDKIYGYTINEIVKDKIKPDVKIKILLKARNAQEIIKTMNVYSEKFSKVFKENKPDILLVLGDRYEVFSIVLSAYLNKIPIAHLYGGEVTQGAMDDFFRHSISKASQYHFVAHKDYAKRLIQLGEDKKNIYTVGSLGCENIKNDNLKKLKELEKNLNFRFNKKNILVAFHPETLDKNNGINGLKTLLSSLENLKDTNIIFTGTNPDLENSKINSLIKSFIKKNKYSKIFYSMGRINYLSTLKHVNLLIGNSSSGIIEAPSVNTPSINLGDRQKGRICGSSVINIEFNKKLIKKNIKKILLVNKKNKIINPYFQKNTSQKIISVLKNIKIKNTVKKKFIDI